MKIALLNPEKLTALRERKNWTQQNLAEESGCSKEQISRWEHGKSLNLRKTSRDRLSEALGVRWEELTSPLRQRKAEEVDEPAPQQDEPFATQLNIRVSAETKTNLELVSLIYGVSRQEIIELAPLLFLITAQRSLMERQARADEIEQRLQETEETTQALARHLKSALRRRRGTYLEEALQIERDSIEKREVFGHLKFWGEPEDYNQIPDDNLNPYANYLARLADGLSTELVRIDPRSYFTVDYGIGGKFLRELVGIRGESKRENEIVRMLANGRIDLREALAQKRQLEERAYEDWLSAKLDKILAKDSEDIRKAFDEADELDETPIPSMNQPDEEKIADSLPQLEI
ncbi:helix-turn-helix transcriptional regulator [uncultured Lamprocystis sp.]|jgi:transcriptional regulator with XRE-family HTH domain|uniref:helix-turn-helix domain-containing protein n=1 Tax=uncultured Lamprocystis sp. TaxID=543132 RepID=UPI0025ED2375|nr:helix-turn-helix transcriptional regulator [uncultured Lamprocystis sp.]